MDGGGDAARIYVGNLPEHFTEKDVRHEFERYGKVVKLDIKKTTRGTVYCFLEFEDPRDAQDAISQSNGQIPSGDKDAPRMRVEQPMVNRSFGGRGGGSSRGGTGMKRGNFIIEISNIPQSGSWQDLKDHFRGIGDVGYADVWNTGDSSGVRGGEVSFFSKRDMIDAIERMDSSTFKSHQGEKARISVREKRGGPAYGDDRNGRGGYGYGYRGEPPADRRGYSGGGGRGGYSSRYRSTSPRDGNAGWNDDRGRQRVRSRSRDRGVAQGYYAGQSRRREAYGSAERAIPTGRY